MEPDRLMGELRAFSHKLTPSREIVQNRMRNRVKECRAWQPPTSVVAFHRLFFAPKDASLHELGGDASSGGARRKEASSAGRHATSVSSVTVFPGTHPSDWHLFESLIEDR